MKYYLGEVSDDGPPFDVFAVTKLGAERRMRKLRKRLDLANHSPDGFAWGYGGSGPAQLALAILADALNDGERAVRLHQDYKWRVIGRLAQNEPWIIQHAEVLRVVQELEGERDVEQAQGA
jgi:hypothetical protein